MRYVHEFITPELKRSHQKGVIFATSIEMVEKLSKFVGGMRTHADTNRLSPQERMDNEGQWKDPNGPIWIIATTGFMQGINVPNVGFVLFIEMPFGLLLFIQGAGRIRGPKPGWTVVLYNSGGCPPPSDLGLVAAGNEFIRTNQCRRLITQNYFEQPCYAKMTCKDLSEEENNSDFPYCDICKPDDPLITPFFTALNQHQTVTFQPSLPPPSLPLPPPPPPLSSDSFSDIDFDVDEEALLDMSLDANFYTLPTTPSTLPTMQPPRILPVPQSSTAPAIAYAGQSQTVRNQQYKDEIGKRRKEAKAAILTSLMRAFQRHCLTCYLFQGVHKSLNHPSSCHHDKPIDNCRAGRFIRFDGWIDFKKEVKKSTKKKYTFCHHCFMPQGKGLLSKLHPNFRPNEAIQ